MIVVDASLAVLGLLHDGPCRQVLAEQAMSSPHGIDVEVAHALRANVRRGVVRERDAAVALGRWSRLAVDRHPMTPHLGRIWQLRDNLSSYDAAYVALAEQLGCPLATADARLAAAPGPRCSTVVYRA